jgi:Ca2+-binding RTX toxin-like protein
VLVSGYTGTYDAAAHGATGSATGVGGVDLSGGLNFGASFTDAPGGTANWTFTGGTNYNDQSGSVAIVINKAEAVVLVSGYTGTYDAAAHGATGSATGVGGVDLSGGLNFGASFTDAPGGTANWTFTGGTNYNDQSGSVAIVIAKADLTINVSNLTKTFGQTVDLASVLGTTINTGVNGETLCVDHSCVGTSAAALVGNYTITCWVSGDGSGKASNYNITVNPGTLSVLTPSVITAVQDGGNLIIVGTNGADTIDVNATNPSAIKINGSGSYSVTGHVIVYGMGSADNITLTGNVNLEAHGGYGNDTITGGAGNDVLFGDEDNDTLTGSAGNDVLIGGSGSDRLVGSAGHDILIAGQLGGAYDYSVLRTLSDNWAAQWGTDSDLADNNTDGDVVDEAGDQLTGSSGHDWFIVSSNDKITDINSMTKDQDKITYT